MSSGSDPRNSGSRRPTAQQIFGGNVRRQRELKGWTIVQLARQCGLSSGFLASIEDGKTDVALDTIERISEALDVEPDVLLSRGNPGTQA